MKLMPGCCRGGMTTATGRTLARMTPPSHEAYGDAPIGGRPGTGDWQDARQDVRCSRQQDGRSPRRAGYMKGGVTSDSMTPALHAVLPGRDACPLDEVVL